MKPKFLLFAVPEHLAGRVFLVPTDPRDEALGALSKPLVIADSPSGAAVAYADLAERGLVAVNRPEKDTGVVSAQQIDRTYKRAAIDEAMPEPFFVGTEGRAG